MFRTTLPCAAVLGAAGVLAGVSITFGGRYRDADRRRVRDWLSGGT